MKKFLTILTCALPLLISCQKAISSEEPKKSRFQNFTSNMMYLSVIQPVNAMNGFTDKRLFESEFRDTTFSRSGIEFAISRSGDSLWTARSLKGEMQFESHIRMLPGDVDILGIRRHGWKVDSSGKYPDNEFSASFGTVSDFIFGWKVLGSESTLQVTIKYTGVFRTDSFLNGKELDYGILTCFDGESSFQSSII